jgi:hypothetical protein
MPLGQGISEMWDALRDRVEVSGHGPTWEITAGSFESALAYARERFGDPAVLDRSDRSRWWPRVRITVTTDAMLAAKAPPLADMALPQLPAQPTRDDAPDADPPGAADPPVTGGSLPSSLEAIFAHQEAQRRARANNQQYS